jgi:hypothetical protein
MNTSRRIPRVMVKALAAGAVLIAAALPMAFASAASAATAPTLTGAFDTAQLDNAGSTITSTAGTAGVTIADGTANPAFAAGDLVVVGTTVIGTVGVASTGSTSEAVTLVSGATTTEAGAAVSIYAPISFGEGTAATPTITVLGLGFAHDGGNASLVSGDKDLSFTVVTETGTTELTATVTAAAASTTNGAESLTLTDDNGTSNALAGAIIVNPDPTVTSIAPSTLADSQVSGLITVTGSFAAAAGVAGTATLTNSANGTTLEVAPTTTALAGGFVLANNGEVTSASATALTFYVAALNSFNGLPAAAGTYTLTVTNSDGGPVTTGAIFNVTAAGITNVSPSAVPLTTTSEPVTINGYGFEAGAAVVATLTGAGGTSTTASTATVTSPNTITLDVTTGSTVGYVSFTVTNPSIGGGNGAVFTSASPLGIGQAGNANATVTAAAQTPTAAIVPGTTTATPVSLVLTGTGFSPYSAVVALAGTGSTAAGGVTISPCIASLNGDTLTCSVTVGTGATAGTDGVEVNSGTGTSGSFEAAISIAGPTITSSSPTAIAFGSPEGTVITLTGTDFNTTATATAVGAGLTALGAGTQYVFADVSPTSATLTLAAPLTPPGSKSIVVTLTETISAGIVESAAPYTITVDNAPTVTALVNSVTKADGVGAGAVNASVTLTGTGFQTGATITKFVNAYGVADTATGTVASVNASGTQLIADITLPAGDVNISDGYTITNPDGGVAKVTAFTTAAITIDAGPTITAVSPTTAAADSTIAFTITGTGFVTGAAVSSSTANATCGAADVVSPTSITASCTFLAAGTTGTSLVVTNPDGGSATSAVVLAAATTTPPAPLGPHATSVHGSAVIGKTVTLTISGSGFYGKPRITSTGSGVRAAVSHDSGHLLTVRVTVSAKGHKGEHTFTITDADGKSCRINYATK